MNKGVGQSQKPASLSRLSDGRVTFAAFETALSMIHQPVFVIDGGGRILYANAKGDDLLARKDAAVRGSLVEAVRAGVRAEGWRLISVGNPANHAGFIAVLEPQANSSNGRARHLSAAVRQWDLTARQAQVVDLVARGATNATVAEALGIKERTVEFHLSAILDKAGVDNRATLIARLLAL